MIQKITKNHEDDSDFISVDCSSIAIQLSSKRVSIYSAESKNASQILHDLLSQTTWSTGSIDASFDIMFRSVDLSSITLLDAIQSVAETFGALIVWDTVHRKVNFFPLNNYGINKGLELSHGKLLTSIKYENNNADFCTRLWVKGKDDLTINSVNPTGGSFLENYSYFIYPFERASNGNVIKHSNYMSDSLAGALIDYNNIKNSHETQFETYVTQLNGYNATLLIKNGELSDLYTTLKTIQDTLDTKSAKNQDATSTIAQQTSQLALINAKISEINTVQTQINIVNAKIDSLVQLLTIDNNLNPIQLMELDDYIIDGEFTSEFVSDPQQLKDLALENFASRIQPQILAEISMVNLFEIFEFSDSSDLDKFNLGDFINIKYEMSNINIVARITEIKLDFEAQDIQVTISNITKGKTDEERFLKNLYTSMGNISSVYQQKYAYDAAVNKTDEVSQLLSETWSANDRAIKLGVNNTTTITNRGIITTSPDDPNRMVIIQSGVIGLTKTGNDHWQTAITADGIVAERLYGVIVATNNLVITNSSGSVRIDSNGFNVTDMTLALTRSDKKSRILMDASNGIKIQTSSNLGVTWNNKFFADTNGDINITGKLISSTFDIGEITGSVITGSKIQTSVTGLYPRIELNNTNNILKAETSPTTSMSMYGLLGTSGTPALYMTTPYGNGFLTMYENIVWLNSSSAEIQISSSRDIKLNSGPGYNTLINNSVVATQSWAISYFQSQIDNLRYWVQSQLDTKSSIGHVHSIYLPDHNHGVGSGTSLATAGGGSVGFVSSGGGYYIAY